MLGGYFDLSLREGGCPMESRGHKRRNDPATLPKLSLRFACPSFCSGRTYVVYSHHFATIASGMFPIFIQMAYRRKTRIKNGQLKAAADGRDHLSRVMRE